MDKELKIAIKQSRRLFTIAHKDYNDNESQLSLVDKISRLKIIDEKAKQMSAKEYEYRAYLFQSEENEEIVDKEIDESESYLDKWRALEIKLTDLINENKEKSIVSDVNISATHAVNSLLHYPKLKLPSFDGNIKNWLSFWGQFQKIDSDADIDNHDKFLYLSQAMVSGTPAAELVNSFPTGGKSYKKALDQLKNRYGREELLVEVYVRDLLSIILHKQNAPKISLRKLYDQLETKLRALETLGVTSEKYAAMLYPLVESCLPNETLRAWQRIRTMLRRSHETELGSSENYVSNSDLNRLLNFIQDEVEGEERVLIASQGFGNRVKQNCISDIFERENDVRNKTVYPHISSATDLLLSTQRKTTNCAFCKGEHKAWNCLKVKNMSRHERQEALRKARLCFRCLKSGHGIKQCKFKANCQLCERNHNTLLCKSASKRKPSTDGVITENNCEAIVQDDFFANISKIPTVFLQTLTVILRGKEKEHKVRAIIDSGSQNSYILKSTASKCNYQPIRQENLIHNLFGGHKTNSTRHNVYKVHLKSLDGNYLCNFDVLDQPLICDQVPAIGQGPWIEELKSKEIHITDIKNNPGPIELLIGADVCGKLLTGERVILSSGLVAVNTLLGWTLMGKSPTSIDYNSPSMISNSVSTVSTCISNLQTLDSFGTESVLKKSKIQKSGSLYTVVNGDSKKVDVHETRALSYSNKKKVQRQHQHSLYNRVARKKKPMEPHFKMKPSDFHQEHTGSLRSSSTNTRTSFDLDNDLPMSATVMNPKKEIPGISKNGTAGRIEENCKMEPQKTRCRRNKVPIRLDM